MRGAGDVRVGEDGEELRRCSSEDAGSVDITHRAGEGGGHRLQRFVRRHRPVRLDEQHSEVALVPVRAGELVFEHGAHEPIVEQSSGAVDDVKGLGLRVVCPDSA